MFRIRFKWNQRWSSNIIRAKFAFRYFKRGRIFWPLFFVGFPLLKAGLLQILKDHNIPFDQRQDLEFVLVKEPARHWTFSQDLGDWNGSAAAQFWRNRPEACAMLADHGFLTPSFWVIETAINKKDKRSAHRANLIPEHDVETDADFGQGPWRVEPALYRSSDKMLQIESLDELRRLRQSKGPWRQRLFLTQHRVPLHQALCVRGRFFRSLTGGVDPLKIVQEVERAAQFSGLQLAVVEYQYNLEGNRPIIRQIRPRLPLSAKNLDWSWQELAQTLLELMVANRQRTAFEPVFVTQQTYTERDQVRRAAAQVLGATYVPSKVSDWTGQFVWPDLSKSWIHGDSTDDNGEATSRLLKNKRVTNQLLAAEGINVPREIFVQRGEMTKNLVGDFAQQCGWPIVLKPVGSSRGKGVVIVHNAQQWDELLLSDQKTFQSTDYLIQQYCAGIDVRLVVSGHDCRLAYRRVPLSVVGDGQSSLAQLINNKCQEKLSRDDPGLKTALAERGLSLSDVLPLGQEQQILDIANVSAGGELVDVSLKIDPSYFKKATEVAAILGLHSAGVDFLIMDISSTAQSNPSNWVCLEVNGSAPLHNFAALGREQSSKVVSVLAQNLKASKIFATTL